MVVPCTCKAGTYGSPQGPRTEIVDYNDRSPRIHPCFRLKQPGDGTFRGVELLDEIVQGLVAAAAGVSAAAVTPSLRSFAPTDTTPFFAGTPPPLRRLEPRARAFLSFFFFLP